MNLGAGRETVGYTSLFASWAVGWIDDTADRVRRIVLIRYGLCMAYIQAITSPRHCTTMMFALVDAASEYPPSHHSSCGAADCASRMAVIHAPFIFTQHRQLPRPSKDLILSPDTECLIV